MAEKYQFNPATLSYSKVKLSFKQRILRTVPYILFFIVISTFLYGFNVIGVQTDKALKKENKMLANQLEQLKAEYETMNEVLDELAQRDNNIYRSVFAAEPIPLSIRNAGFGGIDKYEKYKNLNQADAVIEASKMTDILARKISLQSKSYDKVVELLKKNGKMVNAMPAIQPIQNDDLKRVGSGFGYRIHPVYGIVKLHEGIDFTAPTGTEIYATGDGVVVTADSKKSGYGKHVEIDHGFGYKTVYAHMSKIKVKKGQRIKRGEVIGLVGNTGVSTGPHLHYEVRFKNKAVDPINYFSNDLTPEEFDKIVELASRNGKSFD